MTKQKVKDWKELIRDMQKVDAITLYYREKIYLRT